jgi:hypothetical protein
MKLPHLGTAFYLLLVVAAPAAGQPLVEHFPYNFGGPGSDTAFFSETTGFMVFQQLADNFTLTAPASIGSVHWWGFYGGFQQNHQPPIGDETMRVRFYDARPGDGLPGTMRREETFLNPSRTATGRNVWSDSPQQPEFLYQVNLATPFEAQGNTAYWLEVVQVGDVNSTYRWEYSTTQEDRYAFLKTGMNDWQLGSTLRDLAFDLYAVPEPSSLSFFVIGIVLIGRPSRGRSTH